MNGENGRTHTIQKAIKLLAMFETPGWKTRVHVAEVLGVEQRNVSRWLNALEDAGFPLECKAVGEYRVQFRRKR